MYSGSIGAGKAHEMLKHVKSLKETGFSVATISLADPIKKFVSDVFDVNKHGRIIDAPIDKKVSFEDLVKNFCHYFKSFLEPFDDDNNLIDVIIHKTKHLKTPVESAIQDLPNLKAIRYLYQIIGTDIAHLISRQFWLFLLQDKIDAIKDEIDFVFVDDLRFLFEFLLLREYYFKKIDVEAFYVDASEEVRAKRRNLTVNELKLQSEHVSEKESARVIKPYIQLYFPNNVINNNGGLK